MHLRAAALTIQPSSMSLRQSSMTFPTSMSTLSPSRMTLQTSSMRRVSSSMTLATTSLTSAPSAMPQKGATVISNPSSHRLQPAAPNKKPHRCGFLFPTRRCRRLNSCRHGRAATPAVMPPDDAAAGPSADDQTSVRTAPVRTPHVRAVDEPRTSCTGRYWSRRACPSAPWRSPVRYEAPARGWSAGMWSRVRCA